MDRYRRLKTRKSVGIVGMQVARDGKRIDMKQAMVRNAVVVGAMLLVGLLAGETEAAFRNPDGVAVIIGNRAYEYDVPQVTYAHRDAAAFRRYVVDVLGFDPENVIHEKDADKATLERVFGNKDNVKGSDLWRYLHPDGLSDVVVFYSGHGIPGLNDKRGYLLPVNAHPDAAELNGYQIDMLYDNLVKLKEQQAVRSVHVFLDACFSGDSGGGRLIGSTSAIRVAPRTEPMGVEKLTILTAASGKEVASWDKAAKHGLFTHHLLNALYGGADADADGQVTAAEAKTYLDRHMTKAARRTFGRVQNADLRGAGTVVLARAVGGIFPVRPAIAQERQVGQRFRDCPTCPEMVVVPAGSYEMGSPASEVGRYENEGPVHRVTIAEPFAVGVYEVTRGEFGRFVEATGYSTKNDCFTIEENQADRRQGRHWRNPGFAQTDQHPVVCVSWEDAQAYVRWLSEETGQAYRLLSEAEWEYAARVGQQSRGYKYAGSNESDSVAWYGRKSTRLTHPVGQKQPNALGLYDMSGNVGEWMEDCWNESYAGAPDDGSVWWSGNCEDRVVRGDGLGSYSPRDVRLAIRIGVLARAPTSFLGFRVARAVGEMFPIRPVVVPQKQAGKGFRDCTACPEMMVVPAGSYEMGSPASEVGRYELEGPVHRVTIAQPFAVGVYEVMRGEFKRFVEATGYSSGKSCLASHFRRALNKGKVDRRALEEGKVDRRLFGDWGNPGFRQGDHEPVVCVSWEDAQAYVRWLSQETGQAYRLLSEAEWEYAARGGQQSRGYKYAGSNESDSVAWYEENSGDTTHPVGQKQPNELGLYDMSGNVSEWVEDCWNESYAAAPDDGGVWWSGDCSRRVLRGGNWFSPSSRQLRLAYRYRFLPRERVDFLGFRIARTLTGSAATRQQVAEQQQTEEAKRKTGFKSDTESANADVQPLDRSQVASLLAGPKIANADMQLSVCEDTSATDPTGRSLKETADYWGYDPEEAYAFGLKIQEAVRERNLNAFFSLVDGELDYGPRRKYVANKTFSEVFPDSWRTEVLKEEPPCIPWGWRGFDLGPVRYKKAPSESTDIFRIVGVRDWVPEKFPPVPVGWKVDGRLLPPQCFEYEWMSSDNFEAFAEQFSIADYGDFAHNTGKYFGDPIYPFNPIYLSDNNPAVRLWRYVAACARDIAPDQLQISDSTVEYVYPSLGYQSLRYRILADIPPNLCQDFAPNLPGKCLESYLVDVDYCGGSMGCRGPYAIYGMFQMQDGERIIFPLKNFDTENLARNFLDSK
ncbi:MAG: SUMF1/EgtB/PvdO family nonheme iron enzyme [Nitrospira sp.]|nr:SUMF1/EgtB/PvdO family nonheme iron enzyme [Nitrospira sp.]